MHKLQTNVNNEEYEQFRASMDILGHKSIHEAMKFAERCYRELAAREFAVRFVENKRKELDDKHRKELR